MGLCIAAVVFLTQMVNRPSPLQARVNTEVKTGALADYTPSLRTRFDENTMQCRYFLAESAIPRGGLGLFTAVDVKKGELAQPMPDICIYVADTPKKTDFHTHSWAKEVFLGQFEGKSPRAACEGFATLFNAMPDNVKTSDLMSMHGQTNGGLVRTKNPGAGAISHYYGIWSKAVRDVKAGSEMSKYIDTANKEPIFSPPTEILTFSCVYISCAAINYGDWPFDDDKEYKAPTRTPDWLRAHGRCIDNVRIHEATDPEMGRGAFAARRLQKGTVVAPAPLQTYRDRSAFGKQEPEALFVNYCFQPRGTEILLFPYGPGVNLINHSSKPNVALRWSDWNMNHKQWLNLPKEEFWEMIYPGGLILDVVALRDIAEDEELFMDYGREWEEAWKQHVKEWKPVEGAEMYVYPQDMDKNEPLRTVEEQKSKPCPENLATACWIDDEDRDHGVMKWKRPYYDWPYTMSYCHILKRETDKETGEELYEVALNYQRMNPDYKKNARREESYINTHVPRSAIAFVEKPYGSDMHLKNSFRHPIALPDELVPEQWKSGSI